MKRLFSLLGILVVALSTFAQEFTVGDLTYYVTSTTDKTVQVSNGNNATGDVVVPETVTYNDVKYNVTAIGSSAFESNKDITSVSMPSVTSIGSYAFYNCASLTSVSLPAVTYIGDRAFQSCSNISSLRIGSVEQWCGVQLPSSYAYYASPLYQSSQSVGLYIGDSETPVTNLEIPSTVTKIPQYAFLRTTITSVSAPAATSIGSSAFLGCESLEEAIMPKVETIGSSAFSYVTINSTTHYCKALKYVDLSSVKTIGDRAFYGCSGICSLRIGSVEQWYGVQLPSSNAYYASPLRQSSQTVDLYIGDSETPATSIEVPSTVTEIPNYAFYRTTITSVSAPAATSIGSEAFYNCTSLTSANLPAATSIGSSAFQSCTSLASVSIPAATTIDYNAFYKCTSLTSANFPSATSIGNSAFYNCTSLTSASLPAATSIGSSAFYNCTSLTSVSLPSATSIGSSAFYGCTSLTSASLPAITSIEASAFASCCALSTIYLQTETPPILTSTNIFPTWTMLIVPEEAYETYLAADVYKTIPLQITKDGYITQNVTIEADDTTSKLLDKIGEDNVKYVVNLKISGTINSYDMLIIRNQMTSLRNIDLTDVSIVDCNYEYSSGRHSEKDVIGGDWLKNVMIVKLPTTTKTIGNGAFSGCKTLVSVEIPDGVISIGNSAFYDCSNIKNLSLPKTVTYFGKYAFRYCTGLKEVVIPEGVTTIECYAFSDCTDLETVTIPSSVTTF